MVPNVVLFCLLAAASSGPQPPPPSAADAVAKAVEASELLQKALGFKLKPTGFVAGHVVFNTGSAAPSGDAPFFVAANTKTVYRAGARPWDGAGSLVITGRQSRFGVEAGFNINRWFDADAVLEFDLWALYLPNIPPGITAGTVRLRLAYAQVGTKYFKLLVGQALSVVAPRYPTSIGHLAVAAFTQAGFLWQRIPQVTALVNVPLAFAPPLFGAPRLFAAVSAARPLSGDHETAAVIVFDTQDPGSASLLPLLQARAGLDSKYLTLGVSGQLGAESYQLTTNTGAPRAKKLVETWLAAADAKFSLSGFTLQGQAFVGANVNGMFGMTGIRRSQTPIRNASGQVTGQALDDVRSLNAVGGWVQAQGPVWPGVAEWFVGAGVEHTVQVDLLADGTRLTNGALQAGLMFPVHKHLDAGLESYHVISRYRSSGNPIAWNDSLTAMMRVKL